MPDTQSAIQWYIQVTEGKKAGPTTFERLQQFVKSGKIKPDTKVRNTQPDSVWVLAETIPGLFDEVTESATAEPAPTETSAAETQPVETPAEAVAVTTEPVAEPVVEPEKKGSSIAPFKINIGGGSPSAPKPEIAKKPAFKIDTKAAAKPAPKEEKAAKEPEKVAEKIEQPKPEEKPVSQPENKTENKAEKKPSDKSSVAVKIAFGAPKSKDEKKPSEKSSLFKISTKPAPKEEEAAKEETVPVESTESTESTESADDLEALPTEDIVEEPAAKKTEKKEKTVQKSSSKKKIATIPLLLIVTAVFSLLVGLGGGLTLAFLSSGKVGPGFSIMLGIVVFLFGALLGVVSLLLALLFNRQAEN